MVFLQSPLLSAVAFAFLCNEFDWSKYQREDYVDKFNAMSVDDALQGKEIRVAQDQEGDATAEEYKELSIDVAAALKETKQCKHEVIDAVIQGALTLLNHPSAIQQKPTLQPCNTKKYQVASTKAKNKEVECTVDKSYVSCRCPSFKFDCVYKHSIAVADKVEFWNSTFSLFLNHLLRSAHAQLWQRQI